MRFEAETWPICRFKSIEKVLNLSEVRDCFFCKTKNSKVMLGLSKVLGLELSQHEKVRCW